MYEEINIFYGPIFYVIGSNLIDLGFTYSGLKIFMLLISVGNGILIFLISKKIFKDIRLGLLSTTIYLFMPIHYSAAPMFHPDIIAVFFFLIALYFLLSHKKQGFVIAGILSAISFFTKLPVLPLTIAPMLYFLINKKKNGIIYTITFGLILLIMMIYVNSISTDEDNLRILITWVLQEPDLRPDKILQVARTEGVVMLLGIIGLIIHLKNTGKKSILSYITLSSPISYSTILVLGVGNYVISYIEPFIAIFASYLIFYIKDKRKTKKFKIENKIIVSLLISIIFIQFYWFDQPGNEVMFDWRGEKETKPYNDMAKLHSELLENYTKKGDIVFASPMALYNTERVFPLDDPYSIHLYLQHKFGFKNVDTKINILKKMIENKEIKMLISYSPESLNEKNFFPFYLESFKEPLEQNYDIFQEKDVYYYLPQK